MSSIAESAAGLTAFPCASSSNRCAISFGVLTPSPYFTELSIATLVMRRKVFECTFVCGRPSASIFCHTRRIAMRSRMRFVAVLSLRTIISDRGVVHAQRHPGMHELQHAAARHLIDLQHGERIVERQLFLVDEIVERDENRDLDQARRRERLVAAQRQPLAGVEVR